MVLVSVQRNQQYHRCMLERLRDLHARLRVASGRLL